MCCFLYSFSFPSVLFLVFHRFGAIYVWAIRVSFSAEAKQAPCASADFILICFMKVYEGWEFSDSTSLRAPTMCWFCFSFQELGEIYTHKAMCIYILKLLYLEVFQGFLFICFLWGLKKLTPTSTMNGLDYI